MSLAPRSTADAGESLNLSVAVLSRAAPVRVTLRHRPLGSGGPWVRVPMRQHGTRGQVYEGVLRASAYGGDDFEYFVQADLHGADLHGADLHGADLHGADSGVMLHGASPHSSARSPQSLYWPPGAPAQPQTVTVAGGGSRGFHVQR